MRPGGLQQRQKRPPECLHLLLDLCSGVEPRRSELRPQPRILFREAVVLGGEDGDLLLGDTGAGLGLVPLLLPDLSPVAPEAGGSGLRRRSNRAVALAITWRTSKRPESPKGNTDAIGIQSQD